jgi:uncharacterized protein (DUF952 family)
VTRIYKLVARPEWEAALAAGRFEGSAVDLADGYIHFSTAAQAPETARLHFAGRDGIVIIGFDAERLGEALRWEPSRKGALFPHLYAPLDPKLAVSIADVALAADGTPRLGDLPE